ncbi:MAG: ABC transporter ATP-binding protein, partial [Candidatus Hadarchaeum sp.]
MASVTVKNLFVSYHRGRTVAVDHVSFCVGDGEFCVLLGPSGCGKTTILQCIAGLIRPTAGEIAIGEKIVTSTEKNIFVRPQERNIAMVFQEYALYPNLTVRQNLAFPLECQGLSRKEIEVRVHTVAEMLGITDLLDRRPAQLSGGQRQRVALGRALVRQPTVFLLDEPLGNLDAQLRVQVRYELKRIQRQLHATMIYVTHDQIEALTLADKIVLLKSGRIEQEGSPEELYERPTNLFVAGFIGSPPMNFLEGEVLSSEGALW